MQITQLVEEMSEGVMELTIIDKSKEMKRARRNFVEFWNKLVVKCQHNINQDIVFIENCVNFLTCLSRCFLFFLSFGVDKI